MNKTRIDWCDCTINPVVGCPRLCGAEWGTLEGGAPVMTKRPWCYAYNMNCRFKWVKDFSKPQFFPERLKALESKKPKSIFMNSMSDVAYWNEEQIREVFSAVYKNTQHNYIFLTKGGGWQGKSFSNCKLYNNLTGREFCFTGITVTDQRSFNCNVHSQYDFISVEPLLERIDFETIKYNLYCRQIIIGAETGNRKGKVIPKKEWVTDIVLQADKRNISVFMKESLRGLMGKEFRTDKLIWEIENA